MTDPADLPIVDAHHHLWDLERHFYPWLSPRPLPPTLAGDVTPIAQSYLVEDYLRDAQAQNLVKSVHVEAGFDYSAPLTETRWLHEITDADGPPQAVIAKANLHDPEVERLLAEHCGFPKVRGIRHMVSWHEDPAKTFTDRGDLLTDPQWCAGFALLAKHDLSFDLMIYPTQMEEAARLARRHEDTVIVLNHTGMPLVHDAEGLELWRRGLSALAELPNVSVKISGLGMFDHAWTSGSIRPFVLHTLDTFGPARCLFASNFPVDKLYSSFDRLYGAFKELTRDFSEEERRDLFARNAERIYRI